MFTARENTFRLMLLPVLFFGFLGTTFAQSKAPKIDYSGRSNFINPDTLTGDQKAIFWHFVKLTSEEVMSKYTPAELKLEFAKLGITPKERQRFFEAYKFYSLTMEAHKKSCENWEEFKYLDPRSD